MPEVGKIITRAGQFAEAVPSISTDESIGGLLFDISGFDSPFVGFPKLEENFGSGQVHLITNLDDAEVLGLTDGDFLGGIVNYHLSMFYDYVNTDKQLYIAFADCSADWSFICTMQRATNGKIFQLGVWTNQRLFEIDYITGNAGFTRLATDIETVVEELTGHVGQPSGSPVPLSVVLSANTNVGLRNFNLRKLPNGTVFNVPKVSVLLCQDGTKDVLSIQDKMPDKTPVGSLGFALAVLALAGAEENIGGVDKYNLNKNDHFQDPDIPVNGTHYKLRFVNKVIRDRLSSFGYIIPTTYWAKEGEYFYGSDPTLSSGDYNIISNNRIIHKCRRAVFSVLLPYLHSDQLYDSATKGLSASARQTFEEAISSALSGKLINNGGQYQIDGYQIIDFNTENILNDDAVLITYTVSPVNYNGVLTETVMAV